MTVFKAIVSLKTFHQQNRFQNVKEQCSEIRLYKLCAIMLKSRQKIVAISIKYYHARAITAYFQGRIFRKYSFEYDTYACQIVAYEILWMFVKVNGGVFMDYKNQDKIHSHATLVFKCSLSLPFRLKKKTVFI